MYSDFTELQSVRSLAQLHQLGGSLIGHQIIDEGLCVLHILAGLQDHRRARIDNGTGFRAYQQET